MADEPTNGATSGCPEGRHALSEEQKQRARAAFMAALENSVPPHEICRLNLFTDEEENIIREEVERLLYMPKLPNGGAKERRIVVRLKKMATNEEWAGHARAAHAATVWQTVLPDNPRHAGRYYRRKPLTPTGDKEAYEWTKALRDASHISKEWDKKWFAQLMLDGLPEPVSNFEMVTLFILRKPDGSSDRLVQLRNVLGELSRGEHHKGSLILDAEAFAAPEKFRRWALDKGGFAWSGNQTDLHALHEDNTHWTVGRAINQVSSVGWFPVKNSAGKWKNADGVLEGIWFCEDCAICGGEILLPDEDGIYWRDREGYYLGHRGREGKFLQGKPRMRPELKIGACKLGLPSQVEEPETQNESKKKNPKGGTRPKIRPVPSEMESYREFFEEICRKFYETIGGYEAWLCLGAMFAYGVAPEVFDEKHLFPGLWLHGQMGSGKTEFTGWLMHFWGFHPDKGGISMKATAVGLTIQSENYSNVPLWFDEYRKSNLNEDKEAVLRDSYNREVSPKWSPDGQQRSMKTSLVVSGEGTSSDAATRSRFPHAQVSAADRVENHLEWMNEHKEYFFLFARLLLLRRAEFVKLFRNRLGDWMGTTELRGVSEREKIVHGIDWAAFTAMTDLIGGPPSPGTDPLNPFQMKGHGAFSKFMMEHLKTSSEDVTSETNINVFWTDLMTAFMEGEISHGYFRVECETKQYAPGASHQTGTPGRCRWDSVKLFIYPEPVIASMQQYLVKLRQQVTLSRKDLRDQLSKNEYWIDGKHRWKLNGSTIAGWAFDLDKHPMGLQRVSDEDWEHFMQHPDDPDPRKGPLFSIVHALRKREEGDLPNG